MGVQFCPLVSVDIYKLIAEEPDPLLVPPASQRPDDDALTSNWFQMHVFKLSDVSVEETTALVHELPFVL